MELKNLNIFKSSIFCQVLSRKVGYAPPRASGRLSGEARRFRSTDREKGWSVLEKIWSYMCAWLCIYIDARDQACFMLLKCCVLCVAKDSFRETLCRTKVDGISCAPGLECLQGAQKNESCCGFGVLLVSGEPTLHPLFPMHFVFIPLTLGYLLCSGHELHAEESF